MPNPGALNNESHSPRSAAVDVAVIGAGISGLSVAKSLLANGRTVAVLESRKRVGGRLYSPMLKNHSGRVDLGATWFWPGETRVAGLVAELGVAVHNQYLSGDAIFHQPSGGQRIDGNPIDVPSFRFVEGAESLAHAVADSLPDGIVKLGTQVLGITVANVCTVEHEAGSLTAEHVVLAVPPALATANISFEPALPDHLARLAAMTPVWMGATTKVVAHFEYPFWRGHGLSGSAISHIGPIRELHDMSGADGQPAAIFGFAPNSAQGSTLTAQAAVDQFVELFGPEAANPLEVLIVDWSGEQSTSPPGAEQLHAYETYGHVAFQQPLFDGRVHWASTETSPVTPGHIEGALAAGERAVAAIEESLGL